MTCAVDPVYQNANHIAEAKNPAGSRSNKPVLAGLILESFA